jgi:hypothetical protein
LYVTHSVPVPRPSVYDLYWYFAGERQATFEKRVHGVPPPWTRDPILQTYKFCNVFRASDRVSQYLIRHVAYRDDQVDPNDRLFRITAFRVFSKIETWQELIRCLGRAPTLEDLADGGFGAALTRIKEVQGKLYTGAFILCASDAYGQKNKHLNHVELFRHMFLRDNLAQRLLAAKSLKEVYSMLHNYPLMGDFMSYQIAIDLNYSDLINFSENEFTQPGPGALRGIRKAFISLGSLSPTDVIHWMVEHQCEEFQRLGHGFNGLWGRPLHAVDCQGLFCELDKYCRAAVPELRSARVKIKSKFTPQTDGFELYYPPKWGINGRLPQGPVLGTPRQASLL